MKAILSATSARIQSAFITGFYAGIGILGAMFAVFIMLLIASLIFRAFGIITIPSP